MRSSADLEAGREAFEIECRSGHGGDSRVGECAPDTVTPDVAFGRSDNDQRAIIRGGLSGRRMPAAGVPEPAVTELVAY